MRVPAVLIPYPTATDNHQYFNARALGDVGAAVLLEQRGATAEKLASLVSNLLRDEQARRVISDELVRWDSPHAAELIAGKMLAFMAAMGLCPSTGHRSHSFEAPYDRSEVNACRLEASETAGWKPALQKRESAGARI